MKLKAWWVVIFLMMVRLLPAQMIKGYQIDQGSIILSTGQESIIITPYCPSIFRISRSTDRQVTDTDGVILKPQKEDFFKVVDEDERLWITTDSMKLEVELYPFKFKFYNNNDQLLAQQNVFVDRDGYQGFVMDLQGNEMLFGGGLGAIPLNRRGYRLNLNNEPHWGYGWGEENLNFSIPHIITSENFSVYLDNGAVGYADLGKTNPNQLEMATKTKQNSYFFLCNSNQLELLKSFARLTGTQPMPPRWAFGNLMSRFGYQTEKEAREKLDSMLAAGYPVDAIILDLYWFGAGPENWMMGDLDWYSPSWPDPRTMISDFKKKGVQTILITEPYILETSKNFAEADQQKFFAVDSLNRTNIVEDFFFGRAGLIDLFNPNACKWFSRFYQKQIELGIAGWWGDLGEPEKFHDDLIFFSGKKGPQVKNLYGHYWNKMLYDFYTEHYPERRLFHLNRAGFAGSQRYSSFPWSGDVSRTWGGYRAQIPNLLSMSISNVPFAHSDLGGFCAEPQNEELYLRWLQFGVFNPVFRPHSEKVPSEPIYYSDSIQNWLKPFFELRYRLLPYNYTLAWRQEQFGEPLASPLFVRNYLPKIAWGIIDEYMWGESFLVAPILEPGLTTVDLFLPEGIWYDFYTSERHKGNSPIEKQLSYSNIPIFVKAGTFVPMISPISSTAFYKPDSLEVHYYFDPSIEKSVYTLYDDDGAERQAYQNKHYETIRFEMEHNQSEMVFTATNEGFSYPGRAAQRIITFVVHFPNKARQIVRTSFILSQDSKQSATISLN